MKKKKRQNIERNLEYSEEFSIYDFRSNEKINFYMGTASLEKSFDLRYFRFSSSTRETDGKRLIKKKGLCY